MNVLSLIKENVRELRAYEVEASEEPIKLDANESPYAPAVPAPQEALASLNRYPDPSGRLLKELLARETGSGTGSLMLGNGSDELISLLITAFGGPVLFPTPTFSMYGLIARAQGEETAEVPLNQDFDLDRDAMISAIEKKKPRLIFLSTPNNPTGNSFSREKVLEIIEKSGSAVVVDEAYEAFSSQESFLSLINDHPNLIVLRTLSKIGLAALRLGYMIACGELISEFEKVRLPFNVNALSQSVALSALSEKDRLKESIEEIVSERRVLFDGLRALKGISPYPSDANFILFKAEDAAGLFEGLRKRGILIRNLSGALPGCLRVTVGRPEENAAFLAAMEELLA